jgi:cobalt-precorrin 5A hydrolase
MINILQPGTGRAYETETERRVKMRRVVILSYTGNGAQLNKRLTDYFLQKGDVAVSCCVRPGDNVMSTNEILRREWKRTDAFVFVGALGIAVRHIAPFLESKVFDPAVLVLDEKGEFVIPVVSGHVGGGVELAEELAKVIGAKSVITTATDVQGRFAVDVFAVKNHLWIEKPERIKLISRTLLQGGRVDVWTDMPVAGDVPEGLRMMPQVVEGVQGQEKTQGLQSDLPEAERARKAALREMQSGTSQATIFMGLPDDASQRLSALYGEPNLCILRPRPYILGVGCKKGKTAEELYNFLQQLCREAHIDLCEIAAVASIDVKKEEPGLWELSRRLRADFEVFDAAALEQVEENVQRSAFVRETVGVDNVCERSAYCLAKRWTKHAGKTQTENAGRWTVQTQTETTGRQTAQVQTENVRGQEQRYRLRVGKQAQNGMTMALVQYVPTYRW